MHFTKMHGLGNDYLYVYGDVPDNIAELSQKLSDRHFGAGSDGMIYVSPSRIADFRMRIFNADGSEAKMCGNGIRCVAKFVYDHRLTDKTRITVETKAGIKTLDLKVKDGFVEEVTVDMGAPILEPERIPVKAPADMVAVIDEPIQVEGEEYRITCVSMGNPHAVVFVDDTDSLDLATIGPKFENHEMFPDRVNTEFVHVIDRNTVSMRVWERGSGETLACGTGTCACVYACILNNQTEDEVLVHLLGGDLKIRYDRERHTMIMTGPATTVFEGEINI